MAASMENELAKFLLAYGNFKKRPGMYISPVSISALSRARGLFRVRIYNQAGLDS